MLFWFPNLCAGGLTAPLTICSIVGGITSTSTKGIMDLLPLLFLSGEHLHLGFPYR